DYILRPRDDTSRVLSFVRHLLRLVLSRLPPTQPLLPFAGALRNRSVRREISFQNLKVSGFLDRVRKRMNDLLSGLQARKVLQIFPDGLPGDGEAITVQ